jgi:CheY-like chemotaxis protein
MLEDVFSRGRTTVVYIEADHSNALLMQFLLDSRSNYILHHANDGASGLELCKRVEPDLVITEMHLPDVTAYEVLRVLRDDSATTDTPCIVLSGDAMPAHIERALVGGFDGYWTKPIDIWKLMQNIDDAVTVASLKFLRRGYASKTAASRLSQASHFGSAPNSPRQGASKIVPIQAPGRFATWR